MSPYHKWYLQFVVVTTIFALNVVSDTFVDVVVLLLLLNHPRAASPHVLHCLLEIQRPVVHEIFNEFVDSDESPSSADPRTAMDQDGVLVGVDVHGLVDQIPEYLGVVRGGQVGPLDGLQLGHLQVLLGLHLDGPIVVGSLVGRSYVLWGNISMFFDFSYLIKVNKGKENQKYC